LSVDLLIDCDTGVDDAVMLLDLAGNPEANIVAVGSVHGNVQSKRAALNTRYVLDLLGLDHVPSAVGCWRPMAQPLHTSERVHGQYGLGGFVPPEPAHALGEESAVQQMIRLARERPGELTLLATGPLTNLGVALVAEPDLPELIPRVVIMGGNVGVPGNITPWAEANIWHDPEAADLVFQYGWEVVLVPLDVTMQTLLQGEYLDRLQAATARSRRAKFAWDILQFYLDRHEREQGVRAAAMHDPLAGGVAVNPSICDYLEQTVHVELRGTDTRGMTVADLRGYHDLEVKDRPQVKIAVQVQADRYLNEMVERISQ
jgi:purine nucleosidase